MPAPGSVLHGNPSSNAAAPGHCEGLGHSYAVMACMVMACIVMAYRAALGDCEGFGTMPNGRPVRPVRPFTRTSDVPASTAASSIATEKNLVMAYRAALGSCKV